MTAPWFFASDLSASGMVSLDDREARHAAGSRRLATGEMVQLFDGRGSLANARIVSVSGRSVQVEVIDHHTVAASNRHLHLASALPKGDRQGTMLSMVTQLGVSAFTPLACARSVVKAGRSFGKRTERICIEACKQSRRAHLPRINPPATVAAMVAAAAPDDAAIAMAHPTGKHLAEVLPAINNRRSIVLLVGPEGGFTEEEVATAVAAGACDVSLGAGVLRIETACVALLAAVAVVAAD